MTIAVAADEKMSGVRRKPDFFNTCDRLKLIRKGGDILPNVQYPYAACFGIHPNNILPIVTYRDPIPVIRVNTHVNRFFTCRNLPQTDGGILTSGYNSFTVRIKPYIK